MLVHVCKKATRHMNPVCETCFLQDAAALLVQSNDPLQPLIVHLQLCYSAFQLLHQRKVVMSSLLLTLAMHRAIGIGALLS